MFVKLKSKKKSYRLLIAIRASEFLLNWRYLNGIRFSWLSHGSVLCTDKKRLRTKSQSINYFQCLWNDTISQRQLIINIPSFGEVFFKFKWNLFDGTKVINIIHFAAEKKTNDVVDFYENVKTIVVFDLFIWNRIHSHTNGWCRMVSVAKLYISHACNINNKTISNTYGLSIVWEWAALIHIHAYKQTL